MNKLVLTVALCLFAGVLGAQAQIKSPDGAKPTTHDRPAGGAVIVVPDSTGGTGGGTPNEPPPVTDPTPPSEGEDIPPTEPPVEPPVEDPPPFYGEPVRGKVAFILDASGSMYGSKMASLRAEATGVIQELNEYDELDCMAYGGQFAATGGVKFMWGALLPATDGNKNAAISWVNGPTMNPGGGTPSYAALQQGCQTYPADLDQFFFVTDGYPNESPATILAAFPGWWNKFEDCRLICICIAGGGASFMQQLAASVDNGVYIAA